VHTQRTRSKVQHLVVSIEPPKDHLLVAERANDSGQAALTAAVASTGEERTALLSQAIVYSQQTSSAWTKYQATAAGLPGEEKRAAKYLTDQARARTTSTAALVPILKTAAAGSLPNSEIDTYNATRNDLIELHTLYRRADRALFNDLEDDFARFELTLAMGSAFALVMILVGTVVGMRRARRTLLERSTRAAAARLTDFEGRFRRALELIHNDQSAFEVAERASREMLPDARVSVLVADSSRARLTPIADAPACGVTTPGECPALSTGSSMQFPDSGALDACPVLAAQSEARCSATCVPVAIAGRGAAILHLAGLPGHPPANHGAVDLVARGLGDRLTLLQALATFQLQAARDPLTGLLNRRSLETAVEQMLASNKPYAVAFGDLDHFKVLNDTHGHEAGDRALRAFSRTLRESLRPEDIMCRWGGEEFLIVLPDCNSALAIDAMDRVRTNLALASISGHTTAVTASFGVAQSIDAESFDEVVERADTALHQAKDGGRNQVLSYESASSPPTRPPDQQELPTPADRMS
jgi:diguanylate cyclase (GGDEF)-like protein